MNCLFNCDDHIHFHIFIRSSLMWIVSYAPNLKRNKLKKRFKKMLDGGRIFFLGVCARRNIGSFSETVPRNRQLLRRTSTSSLPRRRSVLGVRHAFLPHERLLNRKINSFPIVRKYQLEITCRLSKTQQALLKSKCWQAKHIRTSSIECDTWPKIFAPDENLGDKRWLFVYFSL